jgi:hypothetical protein
LQLEKQIFSKCELNSLDIDWECESFSCLFKKSLFKKVLYEFNYLFLSYKTRVVTNTPEIQSPGCPTKDFTTALFSSFLLRIQ